jgi:uncharacterized protein YukE
MANQRFDTERANSLKGDLGNGQRNIERELDNMKKKIGEIREWWSGGSEEAFITKFDTTCTKIRKSLQECITGYVSLVNQITDAKLKADEEIANQLKK